MTVEQFENDAARIAKQRIEKRDLTLPLQPRLTSMNRWHGKLLRAHVFFCFAVLILGYLVPSGARLLATLVSPLGSIVYPQPVCDAESIHRPLRRFFLQILCR